jgi:hypothetical protein
MTGRHEAAHAILNAIEDDNIRRKAAALAGQMTDWLATGIAYDGDDGNWLDVPSDLVEWCRSARDLLEVLANG